jgi:hypothetical protein
LQNREANLKIAIVEETGQCLVVSCKTEVFQILFPTVNWVKQNNQAISTDHCHPLFLLGFSTW